MRALAIAVLFTTLLGCMANAPPPAGSGPGAPSAGEGAGFSSGSTRISAPLIIDRMDLRIGTTVHFSRIPTQNELYDLQQLPSLSHVVLSLPVWPAGYSELESLNRLPTGADLIVLLPGYPPSREAVEAWNLVSAPLRLIVVVQEPPPSSAVVADLNAMRGLERVIAELTQPSRSGFERLQRPLGFRAFRE